MKYFLYVLAAALVSAALGGGFGALLAVISDEFVRDILMVPADARPINYATAMGMLAGLGIGAVVGGFCLLLYTVRDAIHSLKAPADSRD